MRGDNDATGCSSVTSAISFWQTVGLALSMFLVGTFFLALSPMLPDVARDLGANAARLGYPGGAYGFALGVTSVAIAPLHDNTARRTMLLAGMHLHATGLLLVAISPTWAMVVAGHALCGCGGGIFMPAAYAAIADRSAESVRAKVLGRVNAGWAASTLVGVPVAAIVGSHLGWRIVMLGLAGLWLVVAMMIARLLGARGRCVAPGRHAEYWSRGVLSRMYRARLPFLFLSTVLIFVGFYGVYAYVGIAVRETFQIDADGAGAFVAIYGLGFLTATLNGRIIDRIGAIRSLCIATATLSLILLAIPYATHSMSFLGLAMYLWGIFQNAAFTAFTAAISKVDAEIRGRAFSINTACVFVGSSIGTVAMGFVNSVAGFAVVGLLCMMATAAASLINLWGLTVARSGR